MFLGRYQLGDQVTVRVLAALAGTPATPDACPFTAIYSESGKVGDLRLPAVNQAVASGVFEGRLPLDERFAVGRYWTLTQYTVGGSRRAVLHAFEVTPSGGPSGQVNALYSYERPQASYLVQGRDSGRIHKGKNPQV